MRLATLDAAMRRGWVCPIRRPRSPGPALSLPRPMASAILGSWVVLPEPVSPQTMTTWCCAIACAISSRLPETGSDSGKVMRREVKGAGKARHYRAAGRPAGAGAVLPASHGGQGQLGDLALVLVVPGHPGGIGPGRARHGAGAGHRGGR